MFTPFRLIATSLFVLLLLSQCQQMDSKVNQKKADAENHVASLPQSPLDNGDGFWVIAHRGVSGSYPENTLSAFQAAIDVQAEMVEIGCVYFKRWNPRCGSRQNGGSHHGL
jgi:hypothetical protein